MDSFSKTGYMFMDLFKKMYHLFILIDKFNTNLYKKMLVIPRTMVHARGGGGGAVKKTGISNAIFFIVNS